ncbi:MAG: caspase family protein [Ignavibacteria bacterium]
MIKKTILILIFALSFLHAEEAKKITVAVLCFDNNSIIDKDKLDPLAKGIAQMLITELTQIKSFKVVERERLNDLIKEQQLSLTGAVDQATIQKVGKLLGAQTLIFGSYVNFFGGKMRLDLRIVETETGLTLKAEEVTDNVDELFSMIKAIAGKIADNYDVKLSDDDGLIQNSGALSVEASLSYSKGLEFEDKARELLKSGDRQGSIKSYKSAIKMFVAAIDKTPGFAGASEKIHDINLTINNINIKNNEISEERNPSINIIEPVITKDDIVYKESIMTVRGKALPAGAYKDIRVNNEKVTFIADNEFFVNINLKDGPNNISLQSIDNKDKPAETAFTVICSRETEAPVISIQGPKFSRGIKIVNKADVIFVRGLVQDEHGIASVSVNGRPAAVTQKGEFSADITLAPGSNKIVIKAADKLNNISEESFVIQKAGKQESDKAGNEKRIALVIGNGDYKISPLRNPVNDAKSIADALKGAGFDVMLKVNVGSQNELKKIIREFGKKIQNGNVGLFYYSGHGLQVKGVNYLIPVGAEINKEDDAEFEGLDVNMVLSEMDFAKNKMNIVILDACRNNPFVKSSRSVANGLVQLNAPVGTLIAYSTSPGSVASDGSGKNGLWTEEFLNTIKLPDIKIEDVFKRVRSNVRKKSNNEQIPWESSSIEGDFYFIK